MVQRIISTNKREKNQRFFQSNFLPENRKGADKVLSMYWFAILILVAGGVVAMVTTFQSYPYDVREVEANLLSDKVVDCISSQGILNQDLFSEEGFDENFVNNFLDICGINLNSNYEEEQYYFEINFYNLTSLDKSLFEIYKGNANFKADCEIEEDYKRFATCVEKRFYSVDELNKQYLVDVLSIVAKVDKNVK